MQLRKLSCPYWSTLWYPLLVLALAILLPETMFAQTSPGASSDNPDTFVLSGTVVNSVTGEVISRALVRTNGIAARNVFSDSEGHFQFEGIPAGQIILTAQKPGYYTEQEAPEDFPHAITIGPNTGAQTVKLTPQSAIFGRITDPSGEPIEHIPVRLICRSLHDGRKVWDPRGMTETDDDGHFRFASLLPGTYYLSAGPAQSEGRILAAGEKPTTGFPHLYYPGVADLSSAAPIQLTAGQQAEADFALNPVPVYQVAGSIGQAPIAFGLLAYTSSGDELMLPMKINSETGTFSLDSVPAGSYVLKAVSNRDEQHLLAEQKINVTSNLENVRLTLAPAISIPVVVHMQGRTSSVRAAGFNSEDRPPVSVSLLPTQPNAAENYSTFELRGGHNVMLVQNVDPGGYTVKLNPQPPWYVQSASYGQANVLYEDMTVAAGQNYPLDIVLRDDSATLTASVRTSDNQQHLVSVVVAPQPATKAGARVLQGESSSVTFTGLPPGDYLVYAFDRVTGLEYSNPEALEPYASQAAHITVTTNQQTQVSLDLIHVAKGE